jgi:hypothetical protein
MDPGESFPARIPHPSLSPPGAILAGGKMGVAKARIILDKKFILRLA